MPSPGKLSYYYQKISSYDQHEILTIFLIQYCNASAKERHRLIGFLSSLLESSKLELTETIAFLLLDLVWFHQAEDLPSNVIACLNRAHKGIPEVYWENIGNLEQNRILECCKLLIEKERFLPLSLYSLLNSKNQRDILGSIKSCSFEATANRYILDRELTNSSEGFDALQKLFINELLSLRANNLTNLQREIAIKRCTYIAQYMPEGAQENFLRILVGLHRTALAKEVGVAISSLAPYLESELQKKLAHNVCYQLAKELDLASVQALSSTLSDLFPVVSKASQSLVKGTIKRIKKIRSLNFSLRPVPVALEFAIMDSAVKARVNCVVNIVSSTSHGFDIPGFRNILYNYIRIASDGEEAGNKDSSQLNSGMQALKI